MLQKIDNAVSKFEESLCVLIFLSMVCVVCWSVICRYCLEIPFLQGEELARYLMIYVVFIGTSIGVKNKSHIGVDVFVGMIPEHIRKYVHIMTEILSCLIFVVLLILSIEMFIYLGNL